MLALSSAPLAAAPAWPTVKLPPAAETFPIGEQMIVNGMPMRMQGFVLHMEPKEALTWFRRNMGKPLMEDLVDDKLVLGRAEGDFYMTVQLEPAGPGGKGVRGTVAVTDLKGAHDRRDENAAANARMLNRLPGGTKLLNQMSSSDGGKFAAYVVAENGHSETLNRNSLVDNLRREGFHLERDNPLDQPATKGLPDPLRRGRTLSFKGKGKEATAVIRANGNGQTSIVLNTVTTMERVK
ncbi:hypothetical protein G4G28_09840 [Massilia sp. Dwa41.01b]|uniref:hypothetical protein n=1 Tax=unclassified Massilia TaxID=2609279 RepID=UPI0015FFD175|nr:MULTISPECIES: hypothetical protein [unclassified Massilia]QNA88719.1 hypothetical protein G4G28_09840 [Massilia sp. Dwa41.01b]QNA99618.1 hypothetical protein G4G31_13515 [Massilia sp. Se16.2.3]